MDRELCTQTVDNLVLHLIFHPKLEGEMTWLLEVVCRKAAVKHSGIVPTELGVVELPWGT